MPRTKVDPRVTKRRVTMRSVALIEGFGVAEWEAVDYVRPDYLDAYVAAMREKWQVVEVSDEPDAGPTGYDGATYVPAEYTTRDTDGTRVHHDFPHPLAGTYFPATDCGPKCKHAPEGARVVYVHPEG